MMRLSVMVFCQGVVVGALLAGCQENGGAAVKRGAEFNQDEGERMGGTGAYGDQSAGVNEGNASPSQGAVRGDSEPPLPGEDAGSPADEVVSNPFVMTAHDPFSTFAADVDTASYDTFRQYVEGGALPPASWVRIEDFVNFFAYSYTAPAADAEHPFAIHLAAAPHPSGRATELLRVGIQAELPPAIDKKQANLVFLVDVSGSMSAPDKLPLVKVLLEQTLGVLAANDTISIVTYASSTGVVLEPTKVSDRVAIERAIDRLESGGSTNGSGGIQLAYEKALAARIDDGINHVLLCTDGDFNVGISDPKALATFIGDKRDLGITMTAVGFGRSRNGDALMEALSNAGDGIYSVVYNEDQATRYANQRMLATLVRVAKDMKIQVELNPEIVLAYRLLGYENRAIDDADFRNDIVDAGDIGAGHRVTALYEIVRVGGVVPTPNGGPSLDDGEPVEGTREIGAGELARVKVRYKTPGAKSQDAAFEVAGALMPAEVAASVAAAGDDFAWAAAVATLAELLRESPYARRAEFDGIVATLSAQSAKDADHAELVSLLPRVWELLVAP